MSSWIAPHSLISRFFSQNCNCVAIAIAFTASTAGADDRRFTYLYGVETQPPGHVEYEQYVTLSWNKRGDPSFFRAAFRHEFEFGITDHLQLAVYLADWRTTYTDDTGTKTEFRNSALELKYNLTNPTTDLIGLGLYGEFKIGNELFELEGKLLAQKNVEDWVFAYNFTIESKWEGRHYDEVSGKVKNYLGVAYQISPKLSIGAELLIDTPIPHWSKAADTRTYLGPTIAWHETGWFIAATMEFALYNVRGAERYQFRTIFGIDFLNEDDALTYVQASALHECRACCCMHELGIGRTTRRQPQGLTRHSRIDECIPRGVSRQRSPPLPRILCSLPFSRTNPGL